MAAFELPAITVGQPDLGLGFRLSAPGDFCVAYNPCSSSYMVQITPEIAATVTANPVLAATLRADSFVWYGVPCRGGSRRQLAIPLWDGSRPAWVSESFKLLTAGTFGSISSLV